MTERLSTHNIQLYIWINVTYDHIFFMHSSVKRHLVCFHVLAIVNSAAVNMGACILLDHIFFPDICTGVGLQGHIVALILVKL